MRARVAVAVVAGVVAAVARAAPPPLDRSLVPAPGASPAVRLPAPGRARLASGAELLVVERHTLPMVGVAVVWKRGAGGDPGEREGLAALTANLLDEGTASRGPLALAEALQGLGTNLEAASGWDSTAVVMVTLSKNLDASLALLADVVLHPAFSAREFERVKGEQIAATEQRKDSAQTVASDAFSEALYAGQRFARPATGTAASLARITRDDVAGFFARELGIAGAMIIVAGDVDAAAVRARIDAAFGGPAPPPSAALPSVVAAPAAMAGPAGTVVRRVIDRPGAPQAEVRIGLPGPPRLTPDYFPLLVMNEILGGGDFSNRLNLNLREAHAYTYGAHSGFAFHRDGGPFVVATAARTGVTGPAIVEALGELARIREAAVKPEELRFAKDGLKRSLARRFETLQDLLFEVANQRVFGLPDDWFTTFAEHVEAVTAEDVLRVARRHLDLGALSLVVVGDRAALAPQLSGVAARTGAFDGLAAPAPAATAPPGAAPRPAPASSR